MIKKILLTLTAMILGIFALGAVNVSAERDGDLTYTVSNGEVTITDCSTSATSVTIPAEIDGYSVSVIGDDSFYNCTELTSIEIPDSVTIIGTGVFEDCISLINVEIPDSVTTIGNCAFRECTGLTSIKIPESVTSISSGAFYMCSGLTSVEIPDGITTINSGAFASCDGLTSIEIPDSIKTIGEAAFYDCNELTEVIIGGNVTSWGADVFDYCSNCGGHHRCLLCHLSVQKEREKVHWLSRQLRLLFRELFRRLQWLQMIKKRSVRTAFLVIDLLTEGR